MRPVPPPFAAVLGLALAATAMTAAGPQPLAASAAADIVLQPGDEAPPFGLTGSDGRTYTLAEFRGVRPVVLAWFPKAFAKV